MDKTLQWQIARGIWVMLVAAAGCAAIYYGAPLLAPFLIAWLLAFLLNPIILMLQNRAHLPRWLAVALSLIICVGASAGIITLVVSSIVLEIADLSTFLQQQINGWVTQISLLLHSERFQLIIERVLTFYDENPQYQETINNNLTSTAKTIADFGSSFVKTMLDGSVAFLTSLPSLATVILIALLAAFFIAKDWEKLRGQLIRITPHKVTRSVGFIWKDLQRALFGYVRAQLILITITAVAVMIGLAILGVPYAVTVGLLIGLVDLMPYLGTGAAMVPWIIYVLLQGNYYLGIGLSVLYGIILIARQLIEPKVLSSSIGLDPLPTLIAMYVGLKLLGVLGLIIGPVSLIIIAAVHRSGVFRDIWQYIIAGKA